MADYISQFTGGEIDARLRKVSELEAEKQDALVSGENIKTVGGQSVLGSGDIPVGDENAVKFTPQTLTDAQKAQARANIDAVSLADIENMDFVTATSLPTASASTMGHIYLIGPDANDNYDRYFTQESGGSYSWVPLGSTQIDLSTYATKAEVDELEANVTDLSDILDIQSSGQRVVTLVDTAGGVTDIVNNSEYVKNSIPIVVENNANFAATDPIQLHYGEVLTVQAASTTNSVRYSEYNPNSNTYTAIKVGESSSATDVKTDSYTAEGDILVVVCFRTASPAVITLTTAGSGVESSRRLDGIEEDLESLDERVSALEESETSIEELADEVADVRKDVDAVSKDWFGGVFDFEYGRITSTGENNPSATLKGMRSITPIYLEKGTIIEWMEGVNFSVFRYESSELSSFLDREMALRKPYEVGATNYYRIECDKDDQTTISEEEFESIKAAFSFTGRKYDLKSVEREVYGSATIFQRFTDFIPKVICIGDSLTAGHVFLPDTDFTDTRKISYPGFFAKLSGCDVSVLAENGIGCNGWLTRFMPLCDFSQYNCCIMKLGHNANMHGTYEEDVAPFIPDTYDNGYFYNGVMYSDSGHTTPIVGVEGSYYRSLDTGIYYKYFGGTYSPVYLDYIVGSTDHEIGAYCRIVEMIKEQNPNILLFLANYQDWAGPSIAAQKVSQISEIYHLPLIDELDHTFINLANSEFHTATDVVHSNIFGYYAIALFYYREIGRYLRNNISKSANSVSRDNFTENLCTDLHP